MVKTKNLMNLTGIPVSVGLMVYWKIQDNMDNPNKSCHGILGPRAKLSDTYERNENSDGESWICWSLSIHTQLFQLFFLIANDGVYLLAASTQFETRDPLPHRTVSSVARESY